MTVTRLCHQTDAPLYREITDTLGEYFFSRVFRSANGFLEVSGVGLFQGAKTKVAEVMHTHCKRTPIGQPLRSLGVAASTSANPSFEARGTRLFTSVTATRTVDVLGRDRNANSFH